MSTPLGTSVHPSDSPSSRELEQEPPSPLCLAPTAPFSIEELQELVVAEIELAPPKKNITSGGSPNSNVPISAHILEQEARVNRALGSKITLRGVFGQGPRQILRDSKVPALNEPTKIKDRVAKKNPTRTYLSRPSGRENAATSTKPTKIKDRVPKKKATGTCLSRPSGRENAATSTKRPWRV
ncbi:hypothetical protein B0H14DRAFT_3866481 [Mycena olivaceomarginata]|nr:hypothetical protein B0H14DRAFT_3866481 [Mycena olivaceomarginata]